MYEREIDATSAAGVQLYTRDTSLDLGRWPTVDFLPEPEVGRPAAVVRHWNSANIKVDRLELRDVPDADTAIDFLEFVDQIVDGSEGVATEDPTTGTVVNRVYVEVHNRGVTCRERRASDAPARERLSISSGNALPTGYTTNVQNGTTISAAQWQTVGIKTVTAFASGPHRCRVRSALHDAPASASLPGQAHYCALAILHSPSDAIREHADERRPADDQRA